MNFHNITHNDMNNGDGLRVVLWLAGCEHHCKCCQNPVTWDPNDGLEFDNDALDEIEKELEKSYVSGITFSGGDPLHPHNRHAVFALCNYIKNKYPKKTIWLYTGYTWEFISSSNLITYLKNVDVIVDGRFEDELKDVNYHWAGSTNQKVINIKKSIEKGEIILHESC